MSRLKSNPRSTPKSSLKELDQAVLTADLPEEGLKAGDVGTVVDVYAKGEGFEVEFFTCKGETIAVATVCANQVRPLTESDVSHARGAGNGTHRKPHAASKGGLAGSQPTARRGLDAARMKGRKKRRK